MKRDPSAFNHHRLIKTNKCHQRYCFFNEIITYPSNKLQKFIKKLDERGIDYYTETSVVYYIPKGEEDIGHIDGD